MSAGQYVTLTTWGTQGLTQHLRSCDVELVCNKTGESRDEESEHPSIAVEERVRPDEQDDLCGHLVPHRESNGNLNESR